MAGAAAHGKPGHHAPARPSVRLRQLLFPESRDILAVVVFAVAVAVLSLASPIAVESLVNTVAFGVLLWPVLVLAGILFTFLGLAAAIKALQIFMIEHLQRRLFVRVVADYAHRMPKLRLEAFDHQYGPELANRFFDVLTLQKALATLLLDGVALVITGLVGMTVLAFYHPFLLGFDILMLLAIAFILFVLGWGGVKSSLHESHAKYEVAGWLEELIRSPRTFKFSHGSAFALAKADHLAQDYISARRQHFKVVWRQAVFSLGLQVVASTLLLGLGGYLVIDRQLSLGQLVAAELIVTLVVASMAKLGKYAETYYDLMTSAEKLGLITDLPLEREGGETLPREPHGFAIRLHGTGRLANRHHHQAPSVAIAAGERVAIVGPPGTGKSTLLGLLCGIRQDEAGRVEFDGIDLRSLELASVRAQIGFVSATDIFAGTVIENIRVGRDQLTPVQIREVLHLVGLTDTVHRLPDALDTQLLPSGLPLSADQAVRLCLARAIIGQPRLLVLDETLDVMNLTVSPDLLSRLFDRAIPWTVLVSTARPDIMKQCDRSIVLSDDGLSEVVSLASSESMS